MPNLERGPLDPSAFGEASRYIIAFNRAGNPQEMRDAWDSLSAYLKREDVPVTHKNMALHGVLTSKATDEVKERAQVALDELTEKYEEDLRLRHGVEGGDRKL